MTRAFGDTPRVSQARLKEILHYEPTTGSWSRHRVTRGVRRLTNVGSVLPCGHRVITVDGLTYRSSHLVFLYMTGRWPADQVDHRNVTPDDDRWDNLRECCEAENRRNTRAYRNNTSGFKGVSSFGSKWRSQIVFNYKIIHLGLFETPELAHAAYAAKAKELFGEFARIS